MLIFPFIFPKGEVFIAAEVPKAPNTIDYALMVVLGEFCESNHQLIEGVFIKFSKV